MAHASVVFSALKSKNGAALLKQTKTNSVTPVSGEASKQTYRTVMRGKMGKYAGIEFAVYFNNKKKTKLPETGRAREP